MSAPRSPRLVEVANRAGVSPATVSRFLNSPGVVAPATAERIRGAIAATGYLPNLTAGALASSRSRLIALLVPDIAQSLFNDTVEAMIAELTAQGTAVMLSFTGSDNSRLVREIDAALSRRVDAIILTGIVTDAATRERLRRADVTIVETWGLPEEPIDMAVGFSHEAVGAETAGFLRGRGYGRPFLVVPDSSRSQQRAAGFVAAWTAGEGDPPPSLVVPVPSHFGQGRPAFRALAALDAAPDVVVCGSDWIAQGVVVEALAAGWRVPDRLAVIGFGNLRIAGDMRPTISSIDIDGARIARETLVALRERAEAGGKQTRRIDIGFRLIARESA